MAVDAQGLEIREKLGNLLDVRLLVDGGVRRDQEAGGLGSLDSVDGFTEDAVALNTNVMRLFEAVEVHVEEEARGRLEVAQMFANEHAIRAQVDVLFAPEDFAGQGAD